MSIGPAAANPNIEVRSTCCDCCFAHSRAPLKPCRARCPQRAANVLSYSDHQEPFPHTQAWERRPAEDSGPAFGCGAVLLLRWEGHFLQRLSHTQISSPVGAEYAAPNGAQIHLRHTLYKDVAPLGLGGRRCCAAFHSPAMQQLCLPSSFLSYSFFKRYNVAGFVAETVAGLFVPLGALVQFTGLRLGVS